MANHEEKPKSEALHLLLAIRRNAGPGVRCLRVVERTVNDLSLLESRVAMLADGGEWRIHRTVNPRDPEKARIELMKRMLEFPERASYLDAEWRTCLLLPQCSYGKAQWLLDVDSKDANVLNSVYEGLLEAQATLYHQIETPKGYHIIISQCDTRKIVVPDVVSLLRDGYYFVTEVGNAIH